MTRADAIAALVSALLIACAAGIGVGVTGVVALLAGW